MKIVIEAEDEGLLRDLMGGAGAGASSEVEVPGMVVMRCEKDSVRRSGTAPHLIELIITFSGTIGTHLFAEWLFDKLNGRRVRRMKINRTIVELDKGEITRVIAEEFEHNE